MGGRIDRRVRVGGRVEGRGWGRVEGRIGVGGGVEKRFVIS